MSFESDSLIDRKRLKGRLGLWRLGAVVAFAGLALALFSKFDTVVGRNHVARISINGVITDDQKRIDTLTRLVRDKHAKALIIRIDSPGGTLVGGETLYRVLREVAGKKPVVAVMGTLAASGGYMTAIGADHIIARAGTITGSIGVILQTTDVTGLLAKLGIKAEAIKSSPLKAIPSPLEPLTKQGRAATRSLIKDMHNLFIDMVAERRELPKDKARNLADGRIFTGRQALANGLIDAIGGEREARRWLAEKHGISRKLPVHDLKIARDRDQWMDFVGMIFGKTSLSERLRLDGLISLWQPE